MAHPPPAEKQQRCRQRASLARKRAALACEECRSRKRRCNGAIPSCEGCSRRMCECVYASEVQGWEWHRNMVRTLRARLEELEGSELSPAFLPSHNVSLARAGAGAAGSNGGNDPHAASCLDMTSTGERLFTESVDGPPAELDLRRAPDPLASRRTTSPWSSESIVPATLGTWIKSLDQSDNGAKRDTTLSRPQATNSQGPSLPNKSCSCIECLDTLCCDMPLRRQADAAVAVFFGRHNRMFPVLHEPTFMRQYEWLWTSDSYQKQQCMGFCVRPSGIRLFLALVNAVFALGGLFIGEASQHSISKAETFFSKVWQTDLLNLLMDEPGLEPIQLGLLMSLYLQAMEKFSRCWNILGLTIRIAQSKGLHLSAIEARKRGLLEDNATQLQREMCARLWSVCVLLDIEISLSFGQPCLIAAASGDALLPSAIDDENLSDDAVAGEYGAQPENTPSRLEYFIQTVKLYETLKKVEGLGNEHATTIGGLESRIQAMLGLHKVIMQWREMLPAYLKYERADNCPSKISNDKSSPVRKPLSLNDLSRRLFCRFLHTTQLTLRPGLEMFFEMKRDAQCKASNALYELVLGQIASQCVLSAVQLNDVLSEEIQCRRFPCWWYNIGYLHTCGSTFLIARLCDFADPGASPAILAKCWDVCLNHLSRYPQISTIARKCHGVLQETDKRCATSMQYRRPKPSGKATLWTTAGPVNLVQRATRPETEGVQGQDFPVNDAPPFAWMALHTIGAHPPRNEDFEINVSSPAPNLAGTCHLEQEPESLDFLDNNFAELNNLDPMSWLNLPYLAQLETGFLDCSTA